MQLALVPNLGAITEAVQKLYGPGLGKIGCLKFSKPYPKMIDSVKPEKILIFLKKVKC